MPIIGLILRCRKLGIPVAVAYCMNAATQTNGEDIMTNEIEIKLLQVELDTLDFKCAAVKEVFTAKDEWPELKRTYTYRAVPVPHPVVAGYGRK